MVTSGQPTHEPSIYLRPKRNSRIYFTYALSPLYFQLYEHEFSKRSQRARANAFSFYGGLHGLMRGISQISRPDFTPNQFTRIIRCVYLAINASWIVKELMKNHTLQSCIYAHTYDAYIYIYIYIYICASRSRTNANASYLIDLIDC